MKKILSMLSYKRPAGSAGEEAFIKRFLMPVPGIARDEFGNYWLDIPTGTGKGEARSPIVWSSHTDTVHATSGRQEVSIKDGLAFRTLKGETKECLGADCTAGVWLMLEMIAARVPGLYIFHREEEIGGNGSSWLAENRRDLLEGRDFAIAFDRRGFRDVITHQFGGRCASDTFAAQLSFLLGEGYRPDSGGTFTDTANYVGLISECTNISVGYQGAHTSGESQDVGFLTRLRDTLVTTDWLQLVASRDPAVVEAHDWSTSWSDCGSLSNSGFEEEDDELSFVALVQKYPESVANIARAYGITKEDILDEERFSIY